MRFNRYQKGGTSQPKLVVWLRNAFEYLIRIVDGDKTFYSLNSFAWIPLVEAQTNDILLELGEVLKHEIPSWQSLSNDPQVQQGDSWRTYVFMAYKNQVASNCAKCPKTFSALLQIDGVRTAWFSILNPNTELPPHEGPYNGMLRYHLGLIIPSDKEQECGIRVGNVIQTWKVGGSLIFDDTHNHAAWNRTNAKRVVLFVDFIRPLPFPLNLLNKFVIGVAGNSTFIKKIIERAENN